MFRNERGATNLECAIVTVCFAVVVVVFVIGMIGAMVKTETQMHGRSDGVRDACVALCRVRFLNGATDVCKFNACITRCNAH